MQKRTFTIYQTDARIQTTLAMMKLKMSQEFSSVQLIYLVLYFNFFFKWGAIFLLIEDDKSQDNTDFILNYLNMLLSFLFSFLGIFYRSEVWHYRLVIH